MTLRVGVHPNNLHLLLMQHWPGAFAGLNAEFVSYAEGRDTGRLLADGRFDVGGTGSTPPIIAQISGLDVLYIAASAPRPANGAILVSPTSPIKTVSDLAGRRIALLDGSFHTYLLARVLEADGLGLKDVKRVELAPTPSRAALQAGEVGAWIAMAPHLDQALASAEVRLLVPCGATIPNRSLFWTIGRRELSVEQISLFTAELIRIGQDIDSDRDRAARILSELKIGGVDFSAWRKAVATRDWTIVPAGDEIVAEQQAEADTLFRHGEVSRRIEPKAAPRAAHLVGNATLPASAS
jgi:NitT/TauT family transport system substrate-binding protein/sulfonate transport system substrate-binding protein